MMNNPITGYQSLADEDYKMLAYVSSLKGLLKPFKSKGEQELLESNARNVREMMEPLAELLIAQDIRRGDTVIVFDPKGDADLLRRVWAEAHRAGRESVFWLFHLGWPEISARYNAVGRFGRISEVASRIAGQLSTEGNSAAFREFAWRFVNIITRALVALGQRPDYARIARHVINIDALFIDYARVFLPGYDRQAWDNVVRIASGITEKNTPRNLQGRDNYVVALEQYLSTTRLHDPILDGLCSAVRYDKTYFDKIVASLLPLLEKLTTGKIAQLLAPDYGDLNDPRPVFDWQQAIRQRAIVYVGLDALSDAEIAAAVGNSMFADLVSVAGHIYKHGVMDGLPQTEEKAAINLHCDEFSELMGDEFIPLINKGGGAGVQVTAYTQTLSDIEARIGDRAKAGQVVGNFNSLIMMRVRETATAELLTRQLPQVDVLSNSVSSGVTDSADAQGNIGFSSNTQDRVSSVQVPLLEPASLVQLPKGQAFALLEGGQLWKLRIPLPDTTHDPLMPENIAQIARYMEKQYDSAPVWWNRPETVVTAKNDPILWLNDSETTEKQTDDTPDTPPAREH
ncbi:TPA: type IV conjugative transfer system coupling protein TraD [Klebsiella variicola subsp. variicola]|nr:type IV conjugative transfer system coupling protein TraD [Klebsiella variicola subsp. variicola]